MRETPLHFARFNRAVRARCRTPRFRAAAAAGLALVALLASAAGGPPPDAAATDLRELLRRQLELGRAAGVLTAGETPLRAVDALPAFYALRGFVPAWVEPAGPLPAAFAAFSLLRRAPADGLPAARYHVAELARLLAAGVGANRRPDAARVVDLELLESDGLLLFAADLATGVVDPVTIHPEWNAARREIDPAAFLAGALAAPELDSAFSGLLPKDPAYDALKRALARYRGIAATGGWPQLPPGPTLAPGTRDERVALLRRRLTIEGFLRGPAVADPELFDPALERAVVAFERRHGLEADGRVGTATVAALNVPVEQRVDQIVANLERWRWLPEDLGPRHLRVNLAGFELEEREDERIRLAMRVVVGKSYTQTPVFNAQLTYLVLNPTWNVPPGIARREIVPRERRDPGYLAREGFDVLAGWQAGAAPLDPATIDWAHPPAGLAFRQRPGPQNALGRVKFMFPNPYDVYLHGTPEQALFARAARTFSHGCIRVERPVDLAADLLADDPAWNRPRIEEAIASGSTRTVMLPRALPVYLLYWTAWVDPDGALELRDDVYGRDARLLAALEQPPPAAAPAAR